MEGPGDFLVRGLLSFLLALLVSMVLFVPEAAAEHGVRVTQCGTPAGLAGARLCASAWAWSHWALPSDCSGFPSSDTGQCYHFHGSGWGSADPMLPGTTGTVAVSRHESPTHCLLLPNGFLAGYCQVPDDWGGHGHWADPNPDVTCNRASTTTEYLDARIWSGEAEDYCD